MNPRAGQVGTSETGFNLMEIAFAAPRAGVANRRPFDDQGDGDRRAIVVGLALGAVEIDGVVVGHFVNLTPGPAQVPPADQVATSSTMPTIATSGRVDKKWFRGHYGIVRVTVAVPQRPPSSASVIGTIKTPVGRPSTQTTATVL